MFTFTTKIDFYDCDPAGILFYARIFNLCHSAYEAMIESFELEEDYWNNNNYIVPIIKSEASYHKPAKYGEKISIHVQVTQLRESSFELTYLVKNSNEEKCYLVKTVHVFVDSKTWKKKPMGEALFKKFGDHFKLNT